MNDFTPYAEKRPEAAGIYRWRVASAAVDGLIVEFLAHMRFRHAGFTEQLSPVFDYWNGCQLTVPSSTEWAPASCDPFPVYQYREVAPLGAEQMLPCPFCKAVPQWSGSLRTSGGGFVIGPEPHHFNYWSIECCRWTRRASALDPRKLAAERNALLRESFAGAK